MFQSNDPYLFIIAWLELGSAIVGLLWFSFPEMDYFRWVGLSRSSSEDLGRQQPGAEHRV